MSRTSFQTELRTIGAGLSILTAAGLALGLGLAGCGSTPFDLDGSTESAAADARMYEGFGGYHRSVTTSSPEAQRWFDQGLQLLYGFNHDEAIRSFKAAAAIDPECAMAWWGVAYASGLHINNPAMTESQSRQGWEASREALRRLDNETAAEKALVRAVAERYEWPAPEDRSHLDQAYADAMQSAWQAHPSDADVGALFAESLMDLQPWDLWTRDGQPKGRTLEIVATLERTLDLDPLHPGANHFFIHTMESSPEPERAVPAADRLVDLVPGAGHLVHMPGHIYARVGRWAEASDANVRAIAADRRYFEVAPEPDFYSLYFVHNLHFLAWSAMMEGRYEVAMNAARDLERGIPKAFLRDWTHIADGFTPVTYHVMIRFGKWEEILNEPEPEDYRHVNLTLRRYARGVALSALGRTSEARAELDAFEQEAARIPDDWKIGNNKAHDVVAVARQMLIGELAYREGRREDAFAALRKGVELEEKLVYDEPPGWMQPVRHALGALLMGAARHTEAEAVYRADLERNPNNGWAMLGLEKALTAQGETDEAERFALKRADIWRRADVRPTSSCYCEP